jgi:imidazole glycerol phosphate synthase subunit HisF
VLDIARRFEDAGVAAIIYTDVARDGMLQASTGTRRSRCRAISIPVIASGDLRRSRTSRHDRAAARKLEGAIAGRRLYDGRLEAAEALKLLRAARAADVFKVRVIPCLDVKDGRVVKAVNFVNLRDAGDPVEPRSPMTRGRRRADLSRHHGEPREPRHDLRRGDAHAEACFMPLTVGGGVRNRGGHPQAA